MNSTQSLKHSGLKSTLPRRKILELFETSKVRHLSAEDVYRTLLADGIDVGLATVYRVLTQFEQADDHWTVAKSGTKGRVSSSVTRLERAARVEEVARMLGGTEITATTRRHAAELLDSR